MADEAMSVEVNTPMGFSGKVSGRNHQSIVVTLLILILFVSVLGNGILYAEFSSCRTDLIRLEGDFQSLEEELREDIAVLEGLVTSLSGIINDLHADSVSPAQR